MKIIGIDPGTENVGIAYVSDKDSLGLQTIICDDNSLLGRKRIFTLADNTIDYLRELLNLDIEKSIIVIEDYSMNSRFFNVLEAEFVGILFYLLNSILYLEKEIGVHFIPSSTMKKIITGSGKATKKQIRDCLSRKYLIVGQTDHSVDALALVECFRLLNKHELDYMTERKILGKKVLLGGNDVSNNRNQYASG